jgi:type 1 glutamine amidotransferase
MTGLPVLVDGQTPNLDQRVERVDFGPRGFFGFENRFYVEITGQIQVTKAGETVFRVTSDDGSEVLINGQSVALNDGIHAAQAVDGTIQLKAGWHDLKVRYFEADGGEELKLEWKPAGASAFSLVDASVTRVPAGLTRVISPGTKRVKSAGIGRPGTGMPLESAHPSIDVQTIRPIGWNPQVGGLAVRNDGKLLVSTFKPNQSGRFQPELRDGELWLVENYLDGKRGNVKHKRIAKELQEPLGLATIGDKIYVSTRTAILELVDTNGDDIIDEQRVVGSGWKTDNYHHFTFGLAEKDGWLYSALSTSITFDAPGINGPNPMFRGSYFRVNPSAYDAKNPLANIEFLSSGHRTPNGVSRGPYGLILTGENQGSWQPSNKVNVLEPGSFFGHYNNTTFKNSAYPDGGVPDIFAKSPFTPPALYLPQGEIANSPAQILTVPSGVYKDHILISDVKYGGLTRGWLEKVDGFWQGGVVAHTQGFEVGSNRLILAPDGSMIMGGIGATETWAWTDPRTGKWTTYGLQRLAPTGKTVFEIRKVSATSQGFQVHFSEPVPATALGDLKSYKLRQWRYEPTVEYGGPKVDNQALTVTAARPSRDGKSVELVVSGRKEGYVVHLAMDVKNGSKQLWAGESWYTLNRIPKPNLPTVSALSVATPRILVFSKTKGFRHSSIAKGISTLTEIASQNGWKMTATEDSTVFNRESLSAFDAVVFLNTTGDVLNDAEQASFERYIRAGGGFVGIHSATDTEYDWPWYSKLVGAKFASHPQVQSAEVIVEDRAHPSTSFLPHPWMRVDEWYDFRANPRPNVRVLASLKPSSYQGGKMADHPIIWCHEFEGGRAWYTGLGHTEGTYDELLFRRHVTEGILWAANGKPPVQSKPLPLSAWKAKGDWEETAGVMQTRTGNNWNLNLVSKEEYGDAQVHVEFLVPKNGNSGVYLMGRYEIQILDSHGVANKDLQSSMCGSIYERWKDEKGYEGRKPAINAARPAGEWQSFDITFRAPRFRAGKKVEDAAFLEVRLNGVPVQFRQTVTGPTRAAMFEDEKPTGPLMLQGDHGPIAFRNIWIRPMKLD